jgi:hypothetical protein
MDPDPLVRGMDTDSDPSTINKSSKKKTLISTVLCLLNDFLSSKADINVPSGRTVISKKT